MRDWLAAAAEQNADRPFLITPDGSLSYGAMEERVRWTAGGLRTEGIRAGDRVGVWVANDVESVVALFAVPRTGAAAVLLDGRLTPLEAAALAGEARLRLVLGAPPDLGVKALPIGALEGRSWGGLRPQESRMWWVIYTSGSFSRPKAVRLTWGNLEASAEASAVALRHTESDRWLTVLPLHHVGGAMILARSARQGGAAVLEPHFDEERCARLLREVTLASLVPTMLERILTVDPGPYAGVRALLLGGGPAPDSLVERGVTSGLPVLLTYGMTETAGQVATARWPGGRPKPLPGVEWCTASDGRIWIRGEMVSPGYLNRRARRAGTWFDTGDIGELDSEDGLRVLGRADGTVISGGENIHPSEVEVVLASAPGVEEVAVVGIPDPTWGQLVVAAYVGSPRPAELEGFARQRLPGFKVPKRWVRAAALPKTSLGKVSQPEVAALFRG